MANKLIKKVVLNKITLVEFYEKDLAFRQENDYLILDKTEILELALMIQNESRDSEFYKELKKGK